MNQADNNTQSRVQPHLPDAEQAVLGTFYLNNEAIATTAAILSAEDFYDPRHQEIYKTVLALTDGGSPIDPMILASELDRLGTLERCGGVAYIASLEQSVISPGNVLYHARLVREKAALRSVIAASVEIAEAAYAEDELETIVGRWTDSQALLAEMRTDQLTRPIAEVVDRAKQRMRGAAMAGRIHTTIPKLDDLTQGFGSGEIIIVAARPSLGKTSLVSQIALHAVDQGEPVVYFSLETPAEDLMLRAAANKLQLSHEAMRTRRLGPGALAQVDAYLDQLATKPLAICDKRGITPDQVRAEITRLRSRIGDPSLIVLDYLQLMHPVRRGRQEMSRDREVASISEAMKTLAGDLGCPALIVSQLNRKVEERRGERPRLSDLRDSGTIEQDADVVIFLWEHEKTKPLRSIRLLVEKQRNGPLGVVDTVFDGAKLRITARA